MSPSSEPASVPLEGRPIIIDHRVFLRHRQAIAAAGVVLEALKVKGGVVLVADPADARGVLVCAALRRADRTGPVSGFDREDFAAFDCPALAAVQGEVAALPVDAEVMVFVARGAVVLQRNVVPGSS